MIFKQPLPLLDGAIARTRKKIRGLIYIIRTFEGQISGELICEGQISLKLICEGQISVELICERQSYLKPI